MKKIAIIVLMGLALACSENKQKQVDDAINNAGDSLVAKLHKVNDTLKQAIDSAKKKLPNVNLETYHEIPIALQWIGWGHLGAAKLKKDANGWYSIKGEQTNKANEFVKIEGKIKRKNATELSFDGTIITYVKYNNDGKSCEKTGMQTFAKSGARKYYRLQNMANCEGGRLVDYVDLFDIDDVL